MTDVVAAPAPGPDTLVRARPTDQPTTEQPTADRSNPGQKADDRPTAAGSDPSPPRPVGVTLPAALRSQGWLAGLPLLAALLWTLGFLGADPREMGSFGLVSLFTAATAGWPARYSATALAFSQCFAIRSGSVSMPVRIMKALNGEIAGPRSRRPSTRQAIAKAKLPNVSWIRMP